MNKLNPVQRALEGDNVQMGTTSAVRYWNVRCPKDGREWRLEPSKNQNPPFLTCCPDCEIEFQVIPKEPEILFSKARGNHLSPNYELMDVFGNGIDTWESKNA